MTRLIDLRELCDAVERRGSATHSVVNMRLMDLASDVLNDPGCSTARLLRLVTPAGLANCDSPVTAGWGKYDLEEKISC
jgi:hypothetical protein